LSIACTVRAEAQAQPFVPVPSTDPFDSAHEGIFTTAVVELNSVPLFRVAAPTDVKTGELSAEERALLVDEALQQLVATDRAGMPSYDASTLRIWTHRSGDRFWIEAVDAHHAAPLTIVTVTSADAKSQQSTPDAVAASWQLTLQNALVQALLKLEPTVEKKHLAEVAEIGTGLTIWTALVLFLLSLWQRRSRTLTDVLAEGENSALDYDAALRRSCKVHHLRVISSASGALFWLTVLSWFVAATWSFAQFSQTTAFSQDLSHGAATIVIIWISAAIINRLFDLAIARMAATWKIHHYLSSEERARVLLRLPTTIHVVGRFKTFALVLVAAFLTVSQLGLPFHSVVTIGGIAALALTFSAQNVLKDVIGGIAVLYDDQYAIGDLVTMNGYTGIVENVTLRIVMIRDINGSAVTISHSAVTSVSNFSRNWSRIDYQLSIGPEGDPDKAIGVIRDTVEQLAQDPDAGRGLLLPIEWIGVHAFTQAWTLIRASIRTAPSQQPTLRREINRLVRRRLAEAGIPFGPPIESQYITPL
jgi:moderate conductance mechanosensitive channel